MPNDPTIAGDRGAPRSYPTTLAISDRCGDCGCSGSDVYCTRRSPDRRGGGQGIEALERIETLERIEALEVAIEEAPPLSLTATVVVSVSPELRRIGKRSC